MWSPEGTAGAACVIFVNFPPATTKFCAPGKKAPVYLEQGEGLAMKTGVGHRLIIAKAVFILTRFGV